MTKKKTNASATIDPKLTLATLAERYLEHMEQDGKSVGTCFSYTMELRTAITELGADTIASEITPALIEKFNACDRVTRLKNGKSKAQPSIDKSRRVIRLALNWAAQTGLIASAPYPSKDDPTPVPVEKKTRKRTKSDASVSNDAPAEVAAEPTAA